jgi:LuxR family transcriptional regulator, maltose regulon positive regulatory protein
VIAAVETLAPAVGTDSLALLETTQTAIEVVLGALLDKLNALPNDLLLALDEYHVIDNRQVHDGMIFFLDRLPPHARLRVSARSGRLGIVRRHGA